MHAHYEYTNFITLSRSNVPFTETSIFIEKQHASVNERYFRSHLNLTRKTNHVSHIDYEILSILKNPGKKISKKPLLKIAG